MSTTSPADEPAGRPSSEVRRAMRLAYLATVPGQFLMMLFFRAGVLPLYALQIGANNVHLGILTAFHEGSFLYGYLFSPLMARVGKRRWMTTLLLAASVACWTIFLVQPIYRWAGSGAALILLLVIIFVVMGLNGVAMNAWWPLLRDIIPGPLIGSFFGRLRTAIELVGLTLTLGASAFLGQQPPAWKFLLPFGLAALGQVGRALLFRQLPDPRGPDPNADIRLRAQLLALRQPLLDRPFLFFCVMTFVLYTVMTLPIPLYVPFLKVSRAFPASWTVASMAGISLGNVLSLIGWGRLTDRHDARLVFLLSCLPLALTHVALALTPAYAPAVPWAAALPAGACFALIGVGSAGFGMAYTAYVFQVTPPSASTTYMGLFTFLYALGAIVGPLLGGSLADALAGVALRAGGLHLDSYQLILAGSGAALLPALLLIRRLKPAG